MRPAVLLRSRISDEQIHPQSCGMVHSYFQTLRGAVFTVSRTLPTVPFGITRFYIGFVFVRTFASSPPFECIPIGPKQPIPLLKLGKDAGQKNDQKSPKTLILLTSYF